MQRSRARRVLELWLRAGRCRPTTLDTYRRDLAAWHRWRSAQDRSLARDLLAAVADLLGRGHPAAVEQLLSYQADLRAQVVPRPLTSATIARRLASVRSLLRTAHQLGIIAWTVDVSERVVPSEDRRGPAASDLAVLLRSLQADRDLERRDRAALRLSWDLGLRRAELCGLQWCDLEGEGARLVVRGKGGSIVRLTLPDATRAALASWISRRGADQGPLLCPCGRHGAILRPLRPLHPGQWWRHLRQIAQAAGLPDACRPHGLRHGGATALLESGAPLQTVQRWGRWRSPDTVARYDDQRRDLAGQGAALAAAHLDAALGGLPAPRAGRLPRRTGDYYPTPPWLTGALLDEIGPLSGAVLDACAGTGEIGQVIAARYGTAVELCSVELDVDRAGQIPPAQGPLCADFLQWQTDRRFAAVLANPPFALWIPCAVRCLELADQVAGVVAVLAFSNILGARCRVDFWRDHPPALLLQSPIRPNFRNDAPHGNDQRETLWIIWRAGYTGPTVQRWLVAPAKE